MSEPQTFIFTGLPGSGKGTQVSLLQEYVRSQDPDRDHFSLSTGSAFRTFIEGDSYTQKLAYDVYKTGSLQPEFLAIWLWSQMFIENLKGGEHMFIDGFPRIVSEAHAFDSAMQFYQRTNPYVLYLEVSKEVTKERLRDRFKKEGRIDDLENLVDERFKWYDDLVVPVIDFFRENKRYHFITINGEQSMEDVHADILQVIK